MISIKIDNSHSRAGSYQKIMAVGLSTDEKPKTYNGLPIANGSTFEEIDKGIVYTFDETGKDWKKSYGKGGKGGGGDDSEDDATVEDGNLIIKSGMSVDDGNLFIG